MEDLTDFLTAIGPEVEDADEESFFLFSQDIPSSNLGFVDSRAPTLDVTIHGQDYIVRQSPTLLSSSRAGGTTGAVLWKITPLIAEWLSTPTKNPLWTTSILNPSSTVLELGCGISSLLALTLAPSIGHYVATDQEYVRRLLRENLDENAPSSSPASSSPRIQPKGQGRQRRQKQPPQQRSPTSNITFAALDWETDIPASLKQSLGISSSPKSTEEEEAEADEEGEDQGFDVLLSCDCIYNEALVAPFVRTCADFCRLRPAYTPDQSQSQNRSKRKPTVCVVAQQQRMPDVFETWLREAMRVFRVWRVADEVLGGKLGVGSGYLVHVLVLRGDDGGC